MEENQRQQKLFPNEVYFNICGDENQLSVEKGDKSITYIRADIVDDLVEQTKAIASNEVTDSILLCAKSIDIVTFAARISAFKTYMVVFLLVVSVFTLKGIAFVVACTAILILSVLVSVWISKKNRFEFDELIETRRQKREELKKELQPKGERQV